MEVNQDGLVEIEFCVARGHPRRVNTFGAGRFQLSSHLAVYPTLKMGDEDRKFRSESYSSITILRVSV